MLAVITTEAEHILCEIPLTIFCCVGIAFVLSLTGPQWMSDRGHDVNLGFDVPSHCGGNTQRGISAA